MKHCPKCLNSHDISKFYRNSRTPDGLSYTCKPCIAEYSKTYRVQNKNSIIENKKKWTKLNKDKVINYTKQYYKDNREQIIKRVVRYRSNKLKTDIKFKLQKNIRHRLGKLLKQQTSSIAVTFLNCSLEELKTYLESKFQPGMTWDNYGTKGWHIDHIIPLSNFNLTKEDELKKACHYMNLQPLWWQDNLSKSNKVE
jgi:hypothetical protein